MSERPAPDSSPGARRQHPPQWAATVAAIIGSTGAEVAAQLCTRVSESWHVADELADLITAAVDTSMHAFSDAMVSGTMSSPLPPENTLRELGALVASVGASPDTLVDGFGFARELVLQKLLEMDRREAVPFKAMERLHFEVLAWINKALEYALDGYAETTDCAQGDQLRRARLVSAILSGESQARLQQRAELAHQQLPEACTLVAIYGADQHSPSTDQLISTLLGPKPLTSSWRNARFVISPEPVDPEQVRAALGRSRSSAHVVIGPHLPMPHASDGVSIIEKAAHLLGAQQIVVCDDHLLELYQTSPLSPALALRLGPLLRLSPEKRLLYGQLLSADLEGASLSDEMPEVLKKPRSTLRYERNRLKQMFGDKLLHRSSRVELILALRDVLPRWRAEAGYNQRPRNGRR